MQQDANSPFATLAACIYLANVSNRTKSKGMLSRNCSAQETVKKWHNFSV